MNPDQKPRTTPKDFFLWTGAMLSVYVSVFSFISLIFDYINYTFPNALSYLPETYSGSMPFEMASLVVLFPLFLVLMRLIRRDIAAKPEKREVWVRRWALVFTIFIAGATVATDLIVLIQNFFSGNDLTSAFLLKVLVVFLVAGGGFLHFLADLRGYWNVNPQKAQYVGWGAGLLVLCTLLAGFIIMGAPWNVRLYRFDEQKVGDLQNIQWQVISYWQQKQKLPTALSDLTDSISGNITPTDPQSKLPYEYMTKGKYLFELCATFNATTQPGANIRQQPTMPQPVGISGADMSNNDNWQHAAGHVCFYRTIDPARYPPIIK